MDGLGIQQKNIGAAEHEQERDRGNQLVGGIVSGIVRRHHYPEHGAWARDRRDRQREYRDVVVAFAWHIHALWLVEHHFQAEEKQHHPSGNLEAHEPDAYRVKEKLAEKHEKKEHSGSYHYRFVGDPPSSFRIIATCKRDKHRHGADWIDDHEQRYEGGEKMSKHLNSVYASAAGSKPIKSNDS